MWRETEKSGIYRHDDCPCCEVEIIAYRCDNCGLERTTHHRVDCDDKTLGHEAAGKQERKEHGTCSCGQALIKI